MATKSAMLTTHDELLAKVCVAATEGPIAPTIRVGRRKMNSQEDKSIRQTGFNRRTNFFIGAIVLIVLGAAALLTFKLIL